MTTEIQSSAEAVKAVAETTGNAIDTTSGLGGFFSKILGPAAKQYRALLHDKVRFHRAAQLVSLNRRFEELRAASGFTGELSPIDFKVALLLLEAASLKTNDVL